MGKGLAIVVALVGLVSTTAFANCTKDRPGLIKAADALTEKLEVFDEALHDQKSPNLEKAIKVTHHFEEGILEFVAELKAGATCQAAITEFQHFHEDIQLIYGELKAVPEHFYQAPVLNAWNKLLPAFVRFQNRLYW